MKRIVLLAIWSLFLFSSLSAQLYLGVKAGPNLSNLLTQGSNQFFDNELYQYKVGFQLGAFAQARFSDQFYIQPELLWINKGSSLLLTAPLNERENFALSYISLPVMAVFRIGPKFGATVGPELGYLVSRRLGGEKFVSLIDYRDLDLSFNGGAIFTFSEAYFLDLRFSFGLFGLEKFGVGPNSLQIRNASMQLSLGYMLSQD